jgi:glycosyltransferase involved in cell wall biosynthesis
MAVVGGGSKLIVSLVVPVFNEEATVKLFHERVRNYEGLRGFSVELVFVSDGSVDRTNEILAGIAERDGLVVVVEFSRNFGKEAAIMAGLHHAEGDIVIPIDVDLQDPIELIPELIAKWREGYEVVLAKRVDRSADSWVKRVTARKFYQIHNAISHARIVENVGDFRLMDRRIVEAVKLLPERQLFMKGILSWVGGKTAVVEYTRGERAAGVSKFNGWKLWNFALEGITSFSTVPLRVWTYLGLFVASCAMAFAAWMVAAKLFFGNPVPGYTSLMTAILFLGGIQLIGIGVLGEYIGRIYMESKRRPRYIVSKLIDNRHEKVGEKAA